ncbi:MAG: chromosome segregation protein SMC [Pirellulales bacterium]
MLKALELFGFKSFADRTRFEFPAGITVVVGPNGSGKSNIVDAIKWVLGEQSAKSLRGREMSDVIFKGSGSGRRKPANAAEATLFFDNSLRLLASDSDEVQVTRRVYRSGEGEYLINGQPCRLRDVRDLFRGTGLGTDAYSLIEQGKVDMLLQASPKDRRAIFEEAAGISRFKAKKVETQRRLLRVDQNLLRLADIVEEVETRLKSVRAQSTKARRYQEYTERLRQLRTHTGRVDWRRLTAELEVQQQRLEKLHRDQDEDRQQLVIAEQGQQEAERQVGEQSELLRRHESDWVQAHARVEAARQRRLREAERVDELAQESVRLAQRLRDARARAAELTGRMTECESGVRQAEQTYGAIRTGLVQQEDQLGRLAAELEEARVEYRRRREGQTEAMRAVAAVGNRLSVLETEHRGLDDRLAVLRPRVEQHTEQLAELTRGLSEREAAELTLAERAQAASAELGQARTQLMNQQTDVERLQEQQSELRARRTAAMERAKLLTELEQKQEGVGAGARDVLLRAKRDTFGPFREVVGMVADLVQVRVEMAPMIDAALGPLAQHIVVDGTQLLDQLTRHEYLPPGRVGLMFVQQTVARPATELEPLSRQPGVLGRADRFVTSDDRYVELIRGLLQQTWFVESLADALHLRQQGYRHVRWVTRAGDLIDVDGTVVVGPRHAVGGLVSRRSELAELKRQLDQLELESTGIDRSLEAARAQLVRWQQELVQLGQRHDAAAAEYTRATVAVQSLRQRRADLVGVQAELNQEIDSLVVRQSGLTGQRDELRGEQDELEQRLERLERQVTEQQVVIEQNETRHGEFLRDITQTRIELAKSEQLLESLASQLEACRAEQDERRQAELELMQQCQRTRQAHGATELLVLAATSEIAELTWLLEQIGDQVDHIRAELARATAQRSQWTDQLTRLRERLNRKSGECHQCELALSQLESERTNLVRRVRDDYGIDLAEVASQPVDDLPAEHRDVDAEIEDLRRKISNIGAVNMEALSELEELEQRYGSLSGQYQDLVSSKEMLEKIIQRINRESRRLFQETLEAIRTNFQQLFRRVFGGGSADIVLEEGVDILEAGIDIIATPPGKQSLNISLLSGGERALTAVTLLLGIFQHRPSPFCVLDEVDGPLDEANIGRFVDVLREFLQWTRFVVVTHSKKTMTAATTLYGVTMQESGVSKRVSVQFDDVSDDGQIRSQSDESLADAG